MVPFAAGSLRPLVSCLSLMLLPLMPSAASAVGVIFGSTPRAYAVSYLYEDWSDGQSADFGFFDQTERLDDPTTASAFQQRGSDLNAGGCAPPCVGHTAGAEAGFLNGGITLRSYAHGFANFDLYYVLGDPPDQEYLPGYASGNIVRSESSAAVFDRLIVTQPVQIHLQGHLSGRSVTLAASDSLIHADDLGNVDFGSGMSSGQLLVTVDPMPVGSPSNQLIAGIYPAFLGQDIRYDQPLATTFVLNPGTYTFTAELRATTRIGNVLRPDLAVQYRLADFGDTVTLELIADDPAAISSESGSIDFLPEPSFAALSAAGLSGLSALARRRRASRAGRSDTRSSG